MNKEHYYNQTDRQRLSSSQRQVMSLEQRVKELEQTITEKSSLVDYYHHIEFRKEVELIEYKNYNKLLHEKVNNLSDEIVRLTLEQQQ